MFFIELLLFLCFHFSFLQSTNLCILPFSNQRCRIGGDEHRLICDVNIFHSYRQMSCTMNKNNYSLLVLIENFAIFYPPFLENFPDIMKTNKVTFGFVMNKEIFFELDFQFIHFDHFKLYITIEPSTKTIHWSINSPWKISFELQYILDLFVLTIFKTNETITSNETFCYHYRFHPMNNQTYLQEDFHSCSRNVCELNGNETRLCLGLTPCSRTGLSSYVCRIDQLRTNDEFLFKPSNFYEDLTIITTNNHTRTFHQLSRDLVKVCFAQRLSIIVIHGRLEIPMMNTTDLQCSNGVFVHLEIWHGNCSTFEILFTQHLQEMYQKNLITLSNFYTGQLDKLHIACTVHSTNPNRLQFSIVFWSIFIVILVLVLIGLLYYHRRYLSKFWRNLTMQKTIPRNLPTPSPLKTLSNNNS